MPLCVEDKVCDCVNLKPEEQVNVCLYVKNNAFCLRQKNKFLEEAFLKTNAPSGVNDQR